MERKRDCSTRSLGARASRATGVIDPAEATRSALQNATSIAALFLTTEAIVAEKPEKTPPPMPGGGGMGHDEFWSALGSVRSGPSGPLRRFGSSLRTGL
jgi:hypothetical protein